MFRTILKVTATSRNFMRVFGLFRSTRHPLNFFSLPLLWLQTPMTVRWASFSAVANIYFYIGSIFEALRLRGHYGKPYQAYDESSVPLFFPRLRRSKRTDKHDDASDAHMKIIAQQDTLCSGQLLILFRHAANILSSFRCAVRSRATTSTCPHFHISAR